MSGEMLFLWGGGAVERDKPGLCRPCCWLRDDVSDGAGGFMSVCGVWGCSQARAGNAPAINGGGWPLLRVLRPGAGSAPRVFFPASLPPHWVQNHRPASAEAERREAAPRRPSPPHSSAHPAASLAPSHLCPLPTPWTVAHQAPLSMDFSRQEYWSGLSYPSPGKKDATHSTEKETKWWIIYKTGKINY